jgi:hypothetical protein
MTDNDKIFPARQQVLSSSSTDVHLSRDEKSVAKIAEINQDILDEALDKVQGGGISLKVLKKDIRSLKDLKLESNSPCDTGTICQDHVTRNACH